MPRPTTVPYISQTVLYNDGGDVPIPGVITRVWNDDGLVNIKLHREFTGDDTRTSVPYGDPRNGPQFNTWSEPQPF